MTIRIDDKKEDQPTEGDVFDLPNGEKIKINYGNVFAYRSLDKGKKTVVEIGYDKREQITLDIDFTDFDNKLEANKKAWRLYWASQSR